MNGLIELATINRILLQKHYCFLLMGNDGIDSSRYNALTIDETSVSLKIMMLSIVVTDKSQLSN